MKLLSLLKELSLHPKNAEELKGLILQLAVQGKITAKWRVENPHVENAISLLTAFKAEKQGLILEKKIKKEKALDPLSPEDFPFDVPPTWAWTHMIDSIHLVTKGATPTSYGYQFLPEGINFIKVECVKEGEIKPHLIDCFISEEANDNQKRSKLEAGDILFSIAGTIGATAIVKQSNLPANTNQALAIIRGSNYVYTPVYLQTLLDSFVSQNTKSKARGAAMNNISLGDLKSMIVPVPPLEEQKAIVEGVNQLFAEVEQLEDLTKERISLKEDFITSALRRLTESGNTAKEWNWLKDQFPTFFTEPNGVKKLRETILQLAVQGKLTANWRANNPSIEPAPELLKRIEAEKQQLIAEKKLKKEKPLPAIEDEDRPYDLPEVWVWIYVGQIFKATQGVQLAKSEQKNSPIKGYKKYLYISDFKGTGTPKYVLDNYPSKDILKDDLIMVNTGATAGQVLTGQEGVLSNNLFKIDYPKQVVRGYLMLFLKSPIFYGVVSKSLKGGANPHMGHKRFYNWLFPFPPLEEQRAIVEEVKSLMALCDELEQQIDNSQTQIEQLMQSCLKEVFEEKEVVDEL